MMEYNIALKAEKDNLDLQYKVAYMRTRYSHMKEAAHHAREADMLANKARYELEAKKAEAALRAKEEAETAAFEKEEAVLLEEFQEAAGGENTEQAIAALLTRQQDNYDRSVAWAKKAAADTSMSARSKVMAQRSAQWEQRKYTTLKNEVNLETEKREKAKQAAIQAAEDAEDRRNAVELTTTERAALYDDIKKSTYVRLTGDATRDLVLQKDSLKKMQEVAERYKAKADSVKDFMSRAKLTEEAYAERKEEYYKDKNRQDTVVRMATGLRDYIERQEAATAAKISDDEKDMIGRIIEKYQNYKSGDGDAEKDKKAGELMLKKYEDGAKVTMNRYMTAFRKEPSDQSLNEKYFLMRERYLTISKMTGPDSPSKVAIKEAYDEALETHKQTTVTTAMTDATTNADVTKALIRAEVPAAVVDTLEKEADNADLNEALTEAKRNPEIAQKLAKKLVQAKGDDDVADAIQGAKTKAALVTVTDPVERERLVEEATIVVCKIRTDLKARKLNEEAEIAFENAETTEAIDLIQTELDAKAAALEATEQAELVTREAASTADMAAKAVEQKIAIAMRVADTKLRGEYFKVVQTSALNVRKIGYEVG